MWLPLISGVVGVEAGGMQLLPQILICRKICFCRKFFLYKMQNFGFKPSISDKIRSKIEILSTHNLLCLQKFVTVCWNFVGNLQCVLQI